MSLGRVLVEEFQPEVLKWLRERVDLVVVNPWVEPQRWELEVVRADAVISRKGKITREQMERSSGRLKIIARTGVGVDPSRVDLEAAKEFRVWVTNQPGSNAVSVAELVFGQMIALVRHTHEANRAVKENRWSDYLKFIGTELAGKTVGIVGMGNIGTRLALRARAFDMDLLVYDPYIPESHVTAIGGRWLGLDDLLDRKSTRLNSSYQIISYAVFCLKKKMAILEICRNCWPWLIRMAQRFLSTKRIRCLLAARTVVGRRKSSGSRIAHWWCIGNCRKH